MKKARVKLVATLNQSYPLTEDSPPVDDTAKAVMKESAINLLTEAFGIKEIGGTIDVDIVELVEEND